MTVLITFTSIGTNAGPFNLYSNVDGYAGAFAVGVSKAQLLAGYPSSVVPNGTTIIRAKSAGVCSNFIDLPLGPPPTSTTTTSTTGVPVTTTTTTLAPTTTTTTTTVVVFNANLTFTNFTAACANPLNTVVYTSTDGEGTHFWSDAAMTIPINSGTDYFKFDHFAIKTSAPNGVVTGSVDCNEL